MPEIAKRLDDEYPSMLPKVNTSKARSKKVLRESSQTKLPSLIPSPTARTPKRSASNAPVDKVRRSVMFSAEDEEIPTVHTSLHRNDEEPSRRSEGVRKCFSVGCVYCGKKTPGLKACSCRIVHYCSKKCEQKDAPAHKKECLSAKAFRKTRKGDDGLLSAGNVKSVAEVMTQTSQLLDETQWRRADAGAFARVVLAQGPLLEASALLGGEGETEQQRFGELYAVVLVRHAAFHADLYGRIDPRGCVGVAERVRARLQRCFAPERVPAAAEGTLETVVGNAYHKCGASGKAREHLERALALLEEGPVPRQLKGHVWQGALTDLAAMAASGKEVEALLQERTAAAKRCRDRGRRWEMRVECAVLGQTAARRLREEAAALHLPDALRVVCRPPPEESEEANVWEGVGVFEAEGKGKGKAGRPSLYMLQQWKKEAAVLRRKAKQARAEQLEAQSEGVLAAVEQEARAAREVGVWSRAAALHSALLQGERRDIDASAIAGQVLSVHACDAAPCHDAVLAEAVSSGAAVDTEALCQLPVDCPCAAKFDLHAWKQVCNSEAQVNGPGFQVATEEAREQANNPAKKDFRF